MMKILALLFVLSFAAFCPPRDYVPIPLDPNDPFEAPLRSGRMWDEVPALTREHILRIVGPAPSLDSLEQALVARGADCARFRRQLSCTHLKLHREVLLGEVVDHYYGFDVLAQSKAQGLELDVCVRWWNRRSTVVHRFHLKCVPETENEAIE